MNIIALLAFFVTLASAMQPADPEYKVQYTLSKHVTLHPLGGDVTGPCFGVGFFRDAGQVNYRFSMFNTGKLDIFEEVGIFFNLQEDGRITIRFSGNRTVELRATKTKSGRLVLMAVPETQPMGPEDENQFVVLCQDSTGARCVIELMGPMVPYRDNPEDMRPLLIDQSQKYTGRLLLWPQNGGKNQVFALEAF